MKKRALFLTVALLATLTVCLVSLSSCGKGESEASLEFTSNGDGTCFVSGIGDCTLEQIIIPQISPKGDKVTAIGDKAFFECFTLKKVTVPNTVTKIGSQAFRGCIYLTQIEIPQSVRSIGEFALMDCKSLTKISVDINNTSYSGIGNCLIDIGEKTIVAGCNASQIPNSSAITSIADYAFFDMNQLSIIDIGDHITSIGDHAFDECDSLMAVTVGGALKEIGDYAFAACSDLKTFSFKGEDALESIGDFAFQACDSLSAFYFPSTLKTVGQGAFWSCDSFKKANAASISSWAQIEFESTSATPLNYGSLYFNSEIVTDLVIPSDVERIGSHAFYNATDIVSITFSDSVTSIGDYAFASCSSLEVLKLGESVKSIGKHAFADCTALKSASFPAATESIGEYALFGCSALNKITVAEENKKYSSSGNCLTDVENKTLIVGCNSSTFPTDIEITAIANYAFSKRTGLTKIAIPNSVSSIGFQAFGGCIALTEVTVESTSGWSAYKSLQDNEGETVDLTVANLKDTYSNYYWKQK